MASRGAAIASEIPQEPDGQEARQSVSEQQVRRVLEESPERLGRFADEIAEAVEKDNLGAALHRLDSSPEWRRLMGVDTGIDTELESEP